jgi:DNA-binding NarL/FixJ family response regulator
VCGVLVVTGILIGFVVLPTVAWVLLALLAVVVALTTAACVEAVRGTGSPVGRVVGIGFAAAAVVAALLAFAVFLDVGAFMLLLLLSAAAPRAVSWYVATLGISRSPQQPACVMLTSFSDDEALFTAIMAGAAGYLLKQVSSTDLVGAVRRLAAGESLLDPSMTAAVLERLRNPQPDDDPRYQSLTEQERRILDGIAEGKTNRQIAQSLYLAEKTVKNYVSSLLHKLGLERRTEAAVYAIDRHRRARR